VSQTQQGPDSGPAHDVKALFGRDALYMALWAVQIVAAAALTPVLTRVLPIEEFGLLAGITAVMQIAFVVASAGLATEIQRKHAEGAVVYAHRLVGFTALLSLSVCGIAHLTGPHWAPALGFPGYGSSLVLSLAWAGASAVTASQLALLRSQDRLLFFGVSPRWARIGRGLSRDERCWRA
jgi:O-antigen/teichoic acid export membrane protein